MKPAAPAVGRDPNLIFVGPSGTGKTYRMQRELETRGNRIVFLDPMRTAELKNAVEVSDVKELLRAMKPGNFKIIYRYHRRTAAMPYSEVILRVHEWADGARIKMTLAVDEVGRMLKNEPKESRAILDEAAATGRHCGLSVLVASQRMFDIDPDSRENFSACIITGVANRYDLQAYNGCGIPPEDEPDRKLGEDVRKLKRLAKQGEPFHAISYSPEEGSWYLLRPDDFNNVR